MERGLNLSKDNNKFIRNIGRKRRGTWGYGVKNMKTTTGYLGHSKEVMKSKKKKEEIDTFFRQKFMLIKRTSHEDTYER